RFLRSGEDVQRDRSQAQWRDQRDHQGAGGAAEDQDDRLRPDREEPAGDRRLFQERGRQLGQDDPSDRLLERLRNKKRTRQPRAGAGSSDGFLSFTISRTSSVVTISSAANPSGPSST